MANYNLLSFKACYVFSVVPYHSVGRMEMLMAIVVVVPALAAMTTSNQQ